MFTTGPWVQHGGNGRRSKGSANAFSTRHLKPHLLQKQSSLCTPTSYSVNNGCFHNRLSKERNPDSQDRNLSRVVGKLKYSSIESQTSNSLEFEATCDNVQKSIKTVKTYTWTLTRVENFKRWSQLTWPQIQWGRYQLMSAKDSSLWVVKKHIESVLNCFFTTFRKSPGHQVNITKLKICCCCRRRSLSMMCILHRLQGLNLTILLCVWYSYTSYNWLRVVSAAGIAG